MNMRTHAELDMTQINNEIDSILADLAYDKIFEVLSLKDKEVLKAMAQIIRGREDNSDPIRVEEIRDAIGMSSETFATYRKRLMDSGIVDGKQFGYL